MNLAEKSYHVGLLLQNPFVGGSDFTFRFNLWL